MGTGTEKLGVRVKIQKGYRNTERIRKYLKMQSTGTERWTSFFEIVGSEKLRIRIVFQNRGTSAGRKTEQVRNVKKIDYKLYITKMAFQENVFTRENGKLHKSSRALVDIISWL